MKRSDDYMIAQAAQVPRPKSPDATNKKLSKRGWERGVQQWRLDLKGVVASLSTAATRSSIVIVDGPGL